MKQLIAVLMVCSLALAASVRAQDENRKKKKSEEQSKSAPAAQSGPKQHAGKNANGPGRKNNFQKSHKGAQVQSDTKVRGEGKAHNDANIHSNAKANTDVNAANDLKIKKGNTQNVSKEQLRATPEFKAKQLKAQSFHAQHLNFQAKPNSAIASVKFNQSYHIQGSENWRGQKYEVFKSYHPEWHDQGWWHSHHDHIVLVGGGWYYWNAGYWYPAWGYDERAAYYPYDGPIYVGQNPAPPDQIIADVQSSLQEQGYYKGEVDGLLGPLTRAALADYQQAQGLETTAAMDEPTLESLGMS
jgi:hypothetical protein